MTHAEHIAQRDLVIAAERAERQHDVYALRAAWAAAATPRASFLSTPTVDLRADR